MDGKASVLTVKDTLDLLNELGEARKARMKAQERYKKLAEVENKVRDELHIALRETGLKSLKSEKYQVSLASRPNLIVIDEAAALRWLREAPNIEEDFYIGLKPAFKQMAMSMLKDTGEMVDGIEVQTKEYPTVKENK